MTALRRMSRAGAILLLCLAAAACGGDGTDDGGPAKEQKSTGSAHGGAHGDHGEGHGDGHGEGQDASGAPEALRVPDWEHRDRPINNQGHRGSPSMWKKLEQRFVDACGGTLCVTLTREFSDTAGEPCGYRGMRPKPGTEIKPGDTVVIVGGANCSATSDGGATGDEDDESGGAG
ncbi:hypothetical protein [Streptomyces sp. Ru87]|uniref:hypothetical protein n=1 Tax=Streptomyces sp. Ru87 TaxID=2044307 RepID=UPI00117E3DBB|nr:hypothetical protein [Streptomyces sp. Ru87]